MQANRLLANVKNLVAGLVLAAAFAGAAHAGPIILGTVHLDPTGEAAAPTSPNGQQVCPDGGLGCLSGSPFLQPFNNFFTIHMLQDGLFSASITTSITPAGTGQFLLLAFELMQGGTSLGTGTLGADLQDVDLAAGTYQMWVYYQYVGITDNSSASWGMTMTTAPFEDDTDIPEPGTLALLGIALTGFAVARRRRT